MIVKRFYWGIAAIFFIFASVFAFLFFSSLWFFQGLIPLKGEGYTIGYQNTFVDSSGVAKAIRDRNSAFVPNVTKLYSRFLYKKEGEGEYIVGIPRLSYQFSVKKEMESNGWQAKRFGWVVVLGHNVSLQDVKVLPAIKNSLKMIGLQRLPIRVIGMLQAQSENSNGFSIYLEKQRKGLHAVINTQSILFMKGVSYRLGKDMVSENMTYVALQREDLFYLPKSFLNALENKTSEMLHFTNTHPRLITDLGSFGNIIVGLNKDSVGIGVLAVDSKASTAITNWINTEQGTRHPKKKAFLLPDRSLGYEYVQGVSNAYFNLNKEKNGCLESENYDETLFLCGRDKMVVLASGDEIGNQLISLSAISGMVRRGMVQGPVMDTLGLGGQFQKIEYSKHDELLEVWADIK